MAETSGITRKIKRLQIGMIVLSFLFIVSVCISIWSAMQIRMVANSLPNYHEIKEDIKAINNIYKVTTKKAPAVYKYTKKKVEQSYDYSKDKVEDAIHYFKK